MCMKTRCELQEDPSKNDEVQVHFFSCVELTFFYNCFSGRNDNREFIKVLLTINTYCFNKKGLIFRYLSLFYLICSHLALYSSLLNSVFHRDMTYPPLRHSDLLIKIII